MDTYKEFLVALRRIVQAADMDAKRLAKATGFTTPQHLVMRAVLDAETLTVGAIAREINLSQATATSIVGGLVRRGVLIKSRDSSDGRKVIVSLTDAGRMLMADAPEGIQFILGRRFDELQQWERSSLMASMQRVASLMDAESIDAGALLHTGPVERAE